MPSSSTGSRQDLGSEMELMTPRASSSSNGSLAVPLLTRRQDEKKASITPTGDVVFPYRLGASHPLVTDALRMTYMVFFLLGVCMLFPWNALISAEDYYSVALRNSSFSSSYEELFACGYMVCNWLVSCILVFIPRFESMFLLGASVSTNPVLQESLRILFPLLINLAIFLALAVLVYADVGPSMLFTITELFCFLSGATGALLQTGVFGLAANFPPVYTQAVMSGQGLAGIGASLAALSTTATEGHKDDPDGSVKPKTLDEVQPAAFAYFMVSVGILIAGVVGFTVLSFLPYARHHASKSSRFQRTLNKSSADTTNGENAGDTSPSSQSTDVELPVIRHASEMKEMSTLPRSARSRRERGPTVLYSVLHGAPMLYSARHEKGTEAEEETTNWLLDPSAQEKDENMRNSHPSESHGSNAVRFPGGPSASAMGEGTTVVLSETDPLVESQRQDGPLSALRTIAPYGIVVLLTFAVTLSCFPGIVSVLLSDRNLQNAVNPKGGRFFGDLFVPILFVLFNVGDTIGRLFAPMLITKAPKPSKLQIAAYSRFLFIPAFLLCHSKLQRSSGLPAIFQSDVFPFMFVCFIGFTNGLMGSVGMMYAPTIVPESERDRAGTASSLFLVSGLSLGTVLSLAIHALACQCNPISNS